MTVTQVQPENPDLAELSSPPRRSWRWISAFVAITIPTLLTAVHAALYGHWVVDDAAITWSYARSIADGAGPVLQPGAAPVEGWSNPSWLAVFIVVAAVGLPLVATAKTVALLCCAGIFVGMLLATRSVGLRRPDLVACIAGCVTALVPSFVIWCFSGLENPLYALAVMWLAVLVVRGPLSSVQLGIVGGGLAALAALTRPDGLVYLAVFPIAVVLLHRSWRPALVAALSVLIAALPVGLYILWRYTEFGLLVPNTAVAKGQGGVSDVVQPTAEPLVDFAVHGGLFVGAAIVLAVAACWTRPMFRGRLIALGVPLVLALAVYGLLAADWMGMYRFATPVWPLTALLGVIATSVLRPNLVKMASGLVLVLTLISWVPATRDFRTEPTVPMCLIAQTTGREFNGYAKILGLHSGSVATAEVGGSALVGSMRIVDLAGLTDPVIAPIAQSSAHPNMGALRDYVFGSARPTFLSTQSHWSAVLDDPRLSEYELIAHEPKRSQIWVRRDALLPGDLERLRAYRREVAGPAETALRNAPRSSCEV